MSATWWNNIPIRLDPEMAEDELHLRTPTQLVKIVNLGKPKALEPTSFDSPSMWRRRRREGGIRAATGLVVTNEGHQELFATPTWHPDAHMRKLGYTRNPAICGHEHKRFRTHWVCADCGTEIGE